MQLTRRKLGAALAGTAAALGQAPPPVPATPEAELKAAGEQMRRNSDALKKVKLPMSTEPAFQFKA